MKTSLHNEIKEISPELNKLEKTNPYSVPENYFSDLSENIKARIKPSEFAIFTYIDRILPNVYLRLAIAILLVISLATASYFFIQQYQNTRIYVSTEDYLIKEIDEDLFIEFIIENQIDVADLNQNDVEYLEYLDEEILLDEL